MSNDLILIKKESALDFFKNEEKVKATLENIKSQIFPLEFDVSIKKGRDEIASAAFRVAKCKTYIDGCGKELVDELKELPKLVDKTRKICRDYLDELKAEVRKPLTFWEEEQARIEAERKAAAEAEALKKQVDADHEIALLLNAEFDRKKAEQRAEQERLQKEREQRIAEQAAAAAKEAAEREAKERALKAEQAAEAERLNLQRQVEEQKALARKAAEDAQRKIQEERAAFERQKAKEAQEDAEKSEEERKKAADLENRKQVHNEIAVCLVEFCEIDQELAKKITIAMAKSLIANVSIKY
jgi:hypothetical protein